MRCKLIGLGGWLKNSFIDYPGTVSTVLFFSGCNLRCPYCHNKALVNRTVDQSMLSEQVWNFLEARRGLIDGVVISGGEPTLYPYLADVIGQIRSMGFRVKLDTNGMLPETASAFAPDYLALDIKTLPERYGPMLGAALDDVEGRMIRSLDMVRRMGENAEVRITVAPRIIDAEAVGRLLPLLSGVKTVVLQRMDQRVELLDSAYNNIAPLPDEQVRMIWNMLAETAERCVMRGEE